MSTEQADGRQGRAAEDQIDDQQDPVGAVAQQIGGHGQPELGGVDERDGLVLIEPDVQQPVVQMGAIGGEGRLATREPARPSP